MQLNLRGHFLLASNSYAPTGNFSSCRVALSRLILNDLFASAAQGDFTEKLT
jgi:hypothetical protein